MLSDCSAGRAQEKLNNRRSRWKLTAVNLEKALSGLGTSVTVARQAGRTEAR